MSISYTKNPIVCRDLNKLHPFVKRIAEAFLEECKKQGINIRISETLRSVERQDYLYAQGRTRPGKKITNAPGVYMMSYHQWGLAFDIYNDDSDDLYNKEILCRAGEIGQKMGLEWGGSWDDFIDLPHFQYTFGLSITDLKRGRKPPTSTSIPRVEDKKLEEAVKDLHLKGIIGNIAAWSTMEAIENNLKNVPSLLSKMGGIDRLIFDKIISDKLLWISGVYEANHVRDLIIKYSKLA